MEFRRAVVTFAPMRLALLKNYFARASFHETIAKTHVALIEK